MHVYAFGSVCRGEIDRGSDVDLLAVVDGFDSRFDPSAYSIYSYDRMQALWIDGNPFAWHLALEARLLFASDGGDVLASFGKPSAYDTCEEDCSNFYSLFLAANSSLTKSTATVVFDLSTVFLAIRNIATCFSLGRTSSPVFGRDAALRIGSQSLALDRQAYDVLARARLLSTRGCGNRLTMEDVTVARACFPTVSAWMQQLVSEVSRR